MVETQGQSGREWEGNGHSVTLRRGPWLNLKSISSINPQGSFIETHMFLTSTAGAYLLQTRQGHLNLFLGPTRTSPTAANLASSPLGSVPAGLLAGAE